MARNKLEDLNDHMFEALERLNDDALMENDAMIEIGRAKAISDLGKTIIQSGKLVLEAQKHIDKMEEMTGRSYQRKNKLLGIDTDE